MAARTAVALLLTSVVLAGCGADPSSPRGRAELFLDAYYVLIDLPRAAEHTAGLARAKVQQGIELTQGHVIDDTISKPTVHYKLLEEHPDGDHAANFVYLADVAVDGESSQRKWMVTVRQQDDGWRVTNFQEFAP